MFSTQAPSLPLGEFTGGTDRFGLVGAGADGGPVPLPIGQVSPGDGIGGSVIPARPAPTSGGLASQEPGQGGFFDVLGSLLNQLDAMLGTLLGGSNATGPGGTTETPASPRSGI
jgi:hypothetical protein